MLAAAGCEPDHFGYWWKWFPERVRPRAPEWVLDGDMVVVGAPSWFPVWMSGQDPLRVTRDDRCKQYGEYAADVDLVLRLYSGLVSLPPNLRYMDEFLAMLRRQPLSQHHDGRANMSEQGVAASVFGRLGAVPIPLSEFPFANALKRSLSRGPKVPPSKNRVPSALRRFPLASAVRKLLKHRDHARQYGHGSKSLLDGGAADDRPWGYHFARAFVGRNQHFERLVADGAIYWQHDDPSPQKRCTWMRSRGQWGREGWSMHPACVDRVAALAEAYDDKPVLELGTSRGYLAAVLAGYGCRVVTVDHEDRGARRNLDGLEVKVVRSDGAAFLSRTPALYSLIVVDLHGNDVATWQALWPKLKPRLDRSGTLVLYNSHLWKMPEWHDQTGLLWVAQNALDGMSQQVFAEPLPGMIICRHE
jgi:hypothetical protein